MQNPCRCDNEAKVLYDMYKLQGVLKDMQVQTRTCCRDDLATLTIAGKTLTLKYGDGTVVSYTES